MKYYHVIYNSSQRMQSGAPGFGVRTFTEDTPEEYIQLLDQFGCFGYDSGTIAQPSPKALLDNGSLISDMPVTYSYVRLYVPSTQKEIFVYLRTICVGFDYPYYIKYTAARTDNFVTDAYIFEEYPGTEFSQIFYENPAEGSASFVPKSPVPSPENEEMKALSVGPMGLLPAEERSFASAALPDFGEAVVELLLGYFEANRRGVPLLVKCDPRLAPSLMADLIRILPLQLEPNATFMTNYQMEGVKDGYRVFFVNDGYQFDYESTGQFQVLDLLQGQKVKTIEAELYRDVIRGYLSDADKVSLDKLSTWLLSPLYSAIRQNSPDVKRTMYNYTIEPSLFRLDDVLDNTKELWPVMIAYFKKDTRNQTLFNDLLRKALLSEQEPEAKAGLVMLFNRMADAGFPIEDLAAETRKEVSSLLLSSPVYLADTLAATGGITPLARFVDKASFEEKDEFLDAAEMTGWWADTFRTFYTKDSLNPARIVSRMLVDEVPEKLIGEVLASLKVSNKDICGIFASVLEKQQNEVERVWPIVEKALEAVVSRFKEDGAPDVEVVRQLSSNIISPLSYGGRRMGKWQDTLLLWSNGETGSVDSENASRLVALAASMGTADNIDLLKEKALPYLKGDELAALFQLVKDNLRDVKPEELLARAGSYSGKRKVDFIGTVKDVFGTKLKVLEKMTEADPDFLKPEDMEAVRVNVYGKKPSKPKKEGEDTGKKPALLNRILGIFRKK